METQQLKASTTVKIPRKHEERRMSDLSLNARIQRDRSDGLSNVRKIINDMFGEKGIDETDVENLVKNREFSEAFHGLFDVKGMGFLVQSTWFGNLRNWAKVNLELKLKFGI